MSEKGTIDRRDLAEFVLDTRENGATAMSTATVNLMYVLAENLMERETDPSISEEDARAVLAELPVEMDDADWWGEQETEATEANDA